MISGQTADVGSPDSHYQVRDPQAIKVVVQRAGPPMEGKHARPSARSSPAEADAELLDISPSGVKLRVFACLPMYEALVIRLEVPGLDRALSLPATVCWTQPAGPANWRLGCAFAHELPGHVLADLAAEGYLDRRKDRRQAVDVEGSARWELSEVSIPVRLVNISAGGFCIRCSQSGHVGERLLLELEDGRRAPVSAHARAVWQLAAAEGWLIGCVWATRKDHDLVRRSVAWNAASERADGSCPRRRPAVRLAVLVAVLVISIAVYFLGQ